MSSQIKGLFAALALLGVLAYAIWRSVHIKKVRLLCSAEEVAEKIKELRQELNRAGMSEVRAKQIRALLKGYEKVLRQKKRKAKRKGKEAA